MNLFNRHIIAIACAALITIGMMASAQSRKGGRRPRHEEKSTENSLKAGDNAPDFELKKLVLKEKKEAVEKEKAPERVKLSTISSSKPVLLLFSSYT